jgi:hypothetical protein
MIKPKLITASRSMLTIDGVDIPGLQSLRYRYDRNRRGVFTTNSSERLGISAGEVFVKGSLTIRSISDDLNMKLYENIQNMKHFQIVCTFFPQGDDTGLINKVTFDECYVHGKDFDLPAGEAATTTFDFTATRLDEEGGGKSYTTGTPGAAS